MPIPEIVEELARRVARLEEHDTREQLAALRAKLDGVSELVSRLEQRVWMAIVGAGTVGGGLGGVAGYLGAAGGVGP